MSKIYKIVNNINGKIYIGKTIKEIEYRFKRHLINASKKINRYLYDAINHYGKENFTIELIEECDKSNENEREMYWIKYYKSNDKEFGYNMTNGGDGGAMCSKSIEKMRLKKIGYITSEETKKKQSEAHRGKHEGDKNIAKRSDVRKKISETLKKKYRNGELKNTLQDNIIKSGLKFGFFGKHSDETKKKLSKCRMGKKLNEIIGDEAADKRKSELSKNWSGKNNPNYIYIDPNEILKRLLDGKTNYDIAKEFNVAPSTIIDKFKKEFNTTPNKYIKDKLNGKKISNNTKD